MEDKFEEFKGFSKIPRLSRQCIITEKIDGTNGQIVVYSDGKVVAGSKNRYLDLEHDNFGFARWVKEHEEELKLLGVGRHFGEWWGKGIQRGYNQIEKKFSLFNPIKYVVIPSIVSTVPILAQGLFEDQIITNAMTQLKIDGSWAAKGYPYPEGIVIYHLAARTMFKKTFENDEMSKGDL